MALGRRGAKGGGLLRTAERLGINRGLFGGSKGWFYVGTGLWTLRTVRKFAARNTEVLLSEELKPGHRLIIANGIATIEALQGSSSGGADASGGRRRRRG